MLLPGGAVDLRSVHSSRRKAIRVEASRRLVRERAGRVGRASKVGCRLESGRARGGGGRASEGRAWAADRRGRRRLIFTIVSVDSKVK